MPLPTAETLQRLLDSEHAWRPAPGEAWESFVRRKAPPAPGWWQPIDRAHYRDAMAAALAQGRRVSRTSARLAPFWFGNNEDELSRDDVWACALVVFTDTAALLERDLAAGSAPWAELEVELVRGSFVQPGRSYAPGVQDVVKFGPFAVVDSLLEVNVKRVVDGGEVAVTPTPTTEVPPFSLLAQLAFEERLVPAEFGRAARALADRAQFITRDED